MIIIYFDPYKPIDKRYGFHVYRAGWIYDKQQSKQDFSTREVAFKEAKKLVVSTAGQGFGHEIMGGAEFLPWGEDG